MYKQCTSYGTQGCPHVTHKRKAGLFILGLGGFALLAYTMLTILVHGINTPVFIVCGVPADNW